jgi:hypothetical protein
MKRKFNAGDFVRIIHSDWPETFPSGTIHEVASVNVLSDDTICVKLIGQPYRPWNFFYEHELEKFTGFDERGMYIGLIRNPAGPGDVCVEDGSALAGLMKEIEHAVVLNEDVGANPTDLFEAACSIFISASMALQAAGLNSTRSPQTREAMIGFAASVVQFIRDFT